MKLTKLHFSEFKGSSREWILDDFNLGHINLLVGQNSSGKSRTLAVIIGLSRIILEPKMAYENGTYNATFTSDEHIYEYKLTIFNYQIVIESLRVNDNLVLKRTANGEGFMYNEEAKAELKFKLPANTPTVTRRDSIQYPFLEDLFNWAINVRIFYFGSDMGKSHFNAVEPNINFKKYDLKNTGQVVDLFLEGFSEYKRLFTDKIVSDFNKIGYDISNVFASQQIAMTFDNLPNKVFGLLVQENDRKGPTDQISMSTGMFRALSIIIYINYYEISNTPGTVLIDDIGEGLDFERSQKLINLLIERGSSNLVQLIMSTNDKFIMNRTPLDHWQIVTRKGGCVKMFNQLNHPAVFEEFQYTGLNNFDFFSSGFFKEGFSDFSLDKDE